MAINSNTPQVSNSADNPLLTIEDVILNSEIVFEFPKEGMDVDHNSSYFPTLESSPMDVSENAINNEEQVFNINSTNLFCENSEVEINDTNLVYEINNTNLVYENNEVQINDNYILSLELEAGQNIIGENIKRRSPTSKKNKWKSETTKKNRMNGQQYLGYT